MAFAETLNQIPFSTTSTMATGFLPPLLRSMSHIFYLLGALANEDVPVSDDEAREELTAAFDHWAARNHDADQSLSSATVDLCGRLETLIADTFAEYEGWDSDTKIANITSVAHRCLGIGAILDRELIGITGSDPGRAM